MSFGDLFERQRKRRRRHSQKEYRADPSVRLIVANKSVEIRETRDIAPDASDPIPDLLHGGIKFGLPTTRDEDMRSLRDKAFGGGQAETAAASSN